MKKKKVFLLLLMSVILFNAFSKTTKLNVNADIRSAITSASAGDTLLLGNGDYTCPGWLDNIKFGSPVVIKAENKLKARFINGNGLNINNSKGLVFDGFELTGLSTNSGLIQIQGGASHITIKNCFVHDAPLDADCIKINQASNISVIGCSLANPGAREAGNGQQETLDFLGVDTLLVSNCYFYGGTSRQYFNAKGQSDYVVLENCIFKDHNGDQGDAAVILGGYSDVSYMSGEESYECKNIIVKNNIIINSRTGIFQITNVKNGYIYNNLAYNCTGYLGSRGLIYVSPGNGSGSNGGSSHIEIFNNMFVNDTAAVPAQIMQVTSTTLDSLTHGNNLYYFKNKTIPSTGVFNPNVENQAKFFNPNIKVVYDGLLSSFTYGNGSGLKDLGNDRALLLPISPVSQDYLGNVVTNGHVDIGPMKIVTSKIISNLKEGARISLQKKGNVQEFLVNGRSFNKLQKKLNNVNVFKINSFKY
jgi:hypothetical protein